MLLKTLASYLKLKYDLNQLKRKRRERKRVVAAEVEHLLLVKRERKVKRRRRFNFQLIQMELLIMDDQKQPTSAEEGLNYSEDSTEGLSRQKKAKWITSVMYLSVKEVQM